MRRAVIVLSIASLAAFAAYGVDKKPEFPVGEAASYPGHVTQNGITIAAKPYNTDELAKSAFGKVKPHEHGILPVLVVIRNDTGKALRLDLVAQFVASDGQHAEAIPADDVTRWNGAKRPNGRPPIAPIPIKQKVKKGPLNTPEIDGRAFLVKLLPPGESANGFFYFETAELRGSTIYLTGLKDAASNQPLFYFEVPLDAQ